MTQAELDTHDCKKGLEDGCDCDHIVDTYDTVTGEHVQIKIKTIGRRPEDEDTHSYDEY
jgi:hypothetical protein